VVFDQISHLKKFYHPKQKPRRGWGLRQIAPAAQSLYRSIFLEKTTFLGFGVFIVIWAMS
jgi:hypothetical protein